MAGNISADSTGSAAAEFQRFAEAFPEALLLAGVDGTVYSVNDAGLSRFGMTRAELVGRRITSLVTDDPERVLTYLRNCGRTNRLLPGTVSIRTGSRTVPHRCEGGAFHAAAHVGQPMVLLRLTQRETANSRFVVVNARMEELDREVARRRQQGEQLAQNVRRKDEFLALLGHELRNPLAPLRNAIALLQAQNGHDTQLGGLAAMMERQVSHLHRLVDDLLDVSRLTRGKIQVYPETVPLVDVMERALEMVEPVARRNGQRLDVSMPRRGVQVYADPARLCQALSNILINAANYSGPGAVITLSVSVTDRSVAILVRDQGRGIAREDLDRIFEPFTQVDLTDARATGGLGLGLTLARGLLSLQNGSVEARSDGIGHGSEFTIRLPLALGPIASGDEIAASPDGGTASISRRVLVVDDNSDFADSLARLLRLWGHESCVAYRGTEALSLTERFRPDVVFLDLGLPEMTGYAVGSELRRRFGGPPDLFLVAVTGWGQESDRRRSREAGFDRHLTKPVDPAHLKELLETR